MKIALIRHGRTEGNINRRYIGKTDEPLYDYKGLDLDYPKYEAVISSGMKRAVQTAEFIYPNTKIIICPDLAECDFGAFENKSYEDLKENKDYIRWLESGGKLPFPAGEAHEAFKNRCIRGFLEILREGYESAAFVIHGGTIMAIMQHLFGGDFYDYQLRNGGMYRFEYDTETGIATEFMKEG